MIQTQEKNRITAVNIVFLISMVISVVVPFLPLDFLTQYPALQLVFSQVILVLPSVVYMLMYRLPYAETVRFKKLRISDMLLSILFGILIQPLMTLINALSMVFSTNSTSVFLTELSAQIPFIAALFLMAVVPAVFEETVYRGVFYNEYSKLNPWKAALLSGFLFGLMHGNINQFCYAAVMGILFALLIEATGSILSTMLVHFWINAGSVVLIYLYPKLYEFMRSFYRMYVEYDNKEMVELLEASFGDMTLSPTEWMQQMMDASAELTMTVPEVLVLYGPQALVMGALAVWVYKKLAMRNGNWERICGLFRKKQPEQSVEQAEGNMVTLVVEPKKRMVTIPLVVAIIIGVAFMIFYEIVIRMA